MISCTISDPDIGSDISQETSIQLRNIQLDSTQMDSILIPIGNNGPNTKKPRRNRSIKDPSRANPAVLDVASDPGILFLLQVKDLVLHHTLDLRGMNWASLVHAVADATSSSRVQECYIRNWYTNKWRLKDEFEPVMRYQLLVSKKLLKYCGQYDALHKDPPSNLHELCVLMRKSIDAQNSVQNCSRARHRAALRKLSAFPGDILEKLMVVGQGMLDKPHLARMQTDEVLEDSQKGDFIAPEMNNHPNSSILVPLIQQHAVRRNALSSNEDNGKSHDDMEVHPLPPFKKIRTKGLGEPGEMPDMNEMDEIDVMTNMNDASDNERSEMEIQRSVSKGRRMLPQRLNAERPRITTRYTLGLQKKRTRSGTSFE